MIWPDLAGLRIAKGNAYSAHNWRWGSHSIEVARGRRRRGQAPVTEELPALLIDWLHAATHAIQILEADFVATLPADVACALRWTYQFRSSIAVVEVTVANWEWLLYRAGDLWRLAVSRDPALRLDVTVDELPRLWEALCRAHTQPMDTVRPRLLLPTLLESFPQCAPIAS